MKRTFYFVILSFFCMASVAQTTDENTIRKILADQVLAWNKGNIDEFMRAYWQNDSLTFISRDGITRGYNATLNRYRKNYDDTAKMGKLYFELLSVKKLSP